MILTSPLEAFSTTLNAQNMHAAGKTKPSNHQHHHLGHLEEVIVDLPLSVLPHFALNYPLNVRGVRIPLHRQARMAIDSPSTAALSAAAPTLMPFLVPEDVLALSCSARWLLECYRTKSKRLVLRLKDMGSAGHAAGGKEYWYNITRRSNTNSSSSSIIAVTISNKRALDAAVASLLTRQACLTTLRVSDASALTGVARAFMPPQLHNCSISTYQCGSLLTTLVLEELGTNASGWFAMSRALAARALPVLERLEVRESCLPDVRLVPVLNALGSEGWITKKEREGRGLGTVEEEEEEEEEEKGDVDRVMVCPALKHLKLGSRMGANSLQALAAALEARQVGKREGNQKKKDGQQQQQQQQQHNRRKE